MSRVFVTTSPLESPSVAVKVMMSGKVAVPMLTMPRSSQFPVVATTVWPRSASMTHVLPLRLSQV
jgi:hypothetical protein